MNEGMAEYIGLKGYSRKEFVHIRDRYDNLSRTSFHTNYFCDSRGGSNQNKILEEDVKIDIKNVCPCIKKISKKHGVFFFLLRLLFRTFFLVRWSGLRCFYWAVFNHLRGNKGKSRCFACLRLVRQNSHA